MEMSVAQKKKVLLSFVGTHDPFAPTKDSDTEASKGAILSLCDKLSPDIAYLFPSSEGDKQDVPTLHRAEEILEILTTEKCKIIPLTGKDPTDFERLSVEFQRCLKQVREELGELDNYEFHINCSSGTQQMTALSYVFANSGLFPDVERWQVRNPKFTGERIRQVDITFLEEHVIIERIKNNVAVYAFPAIADDCKWLANMGITNDRKAIVKLLKKLFRAYSFQDNMRYDEAYKLVKECLSPAQDAISHYADSLNIIKEQFSMLEQLRANSVEESPTNLTDLYFNIERSFEREAFADVLARYRRLREGLYYFRLSSIWKINPREVRFKDLDDIENTLRSKKDKEVLRFCDEYGARNAKLNYDRNMTIVAHGMRPVVEQQAREALEISKVMIKGLLPNSEKLIAEYPFKKEHFIELVSLLEKL